MIDLFTGVNMGVKVVVFELKKRVLEMCSGKIRLEDIEDFENL